MSFPTTMDRAVASPGWLAAFVLLAAVLGANGTARGALIPLSFEELTHKSKHVVTGKVIRTHSYYEDVENLGTIIFTDVTIRISSRILGTFEKKEMTIKVPGGVVGKVGQLWAEAAEFTEGELVLVFVKRVQEAAQGHGLEAGQVPSLAGCRRGPRQGRSADRQEHAPLDRAHSGQSVRRDETSRQHDTPRDRGGGQAMKDQRIRSACRRVLPALVMGFSRSPLRSPRSRSSGSGRCLE